jgi:hypothetical protein
MDLLHKVKDKYTGIMHHLRVPVPDRCMAERFLVSKVLISLDTLVFSSLETVDSFD